MLLILLNSPLFICELKKGALILDCQLPTPTSLKSAFLLDIYSKQEVLNTVFKQLIS